ncbi:dynein axonemal heavy chain 1 isoform X2 [Microplitis mediator]|nr:dynein axonemal heavy chain 1 isoform X2 [Microplitis mediator]
MKNFEEIKKKLHLNILYVRPEVHDALSRIFLLCRNVSYMSLFSPNPGCSLTLEQFKASQLEYSSKIIKYLKEQWVQQIVDSILIGFRDVSKGFFKINQVNPRVYEVIKIKRFVSLTIQIMQTSLNTLIKTSISQYLSLLTTSEPTQEILMPENFNINFIRSKFLLESSNPIFELNLIANYKGINYSMNVNNFIRTLICIIDEVVIQLHEITNPQILLFNKLKFPPDLFLSPIGLMDDSIVDVKKSIEFIYRPSICLLDEFSKQYDEYIELLNLDIEIFISEIREKNFDTHEIYEAIIYYTSELDSLDAKIPDIFYIKSFKIKLEFKKFLIEKYKKIINGFVDVLTARCRQKINTILANYLSIEDKLIKDSDYIEELIKLQKYIADIPEQIIKLRNEMEFIITEYELLDTIKYNISDEDFAMKWEAIGYPSKIEGQIEFAAERMKREFEKFMKIQKNDRLLLEEKIKVLTSDFERIIGFSEIDRINEWALEVKRTRKSLDYCRTQSLILNQRQSFFDLPVTSYEHLEKLIDDFEPYDILWTTASDWVKAEETWLENPLISIDNNQLEKSIEEMEKKIYYCSEIFNNQPDILKITAYINNKIQSFKPYIHLINIIEFPGMKERHFDEINEHTGIQISTPTCSLTLKNLLDLRIMDYMEIITRVADNARQEYSIEEALDNIAVSWRNIQIEIIPYSGSTETCIVNISNEIMTKLYEDRSEIEKISSSNYSAMFENFVNEWNISLDSIQKVLTTWTDVQKMWIYLEPIFSNEGISRQLPVEYKKFSTVQRNWRRIIKKAQANPYVLQLCSDKNLLQQLKDCIPLIEFVKKGLIKNAHAIEPYVNNKSFENIKTFDCKAQDQD